MTSYEAPEARVPDHSSTGSLSQAKSNAFSSVAALCCSSAAIVIAFIGVLQLDLPIIRYVRSVTVHLPWDQLTIPWMAFTSNAGDWIGEGSHLVAVSVVLLAVGWLFSKQTIKASGLETLLAHGIAALLANGLKHLLGRPRPKFMHSGEWQVTPSLTSGLDSFPSGHTTASFAVATVLAKRFPAFGPLCVGIAAFVALSRVLRGSHFPTDVLGGAVLGVLCGAIASAPLKQWRTSFQNGLRHAALGTCATFALLWSLSHQAEEGIAGALLVVVGATALTSGLWLRRTTWFGKEKSFMGRQSKVSLALIAYGLAAMTTGPLVVASVGFACMAYWFHLSGLSGEHRQDSPAWRIVREVALLGSLLLALLVLYSGRGVLPFQ